MTFQLIIPKDYQPHLDLLEVELAIKNIKDFFENNLAKVLNLTRVTAPLFVRSGTGINDNLNGVELPVRFSVKGDNHAEVEMVQSLAKWKRLALARHGFKVGQGLMDYTDELPKVDNESRIESKKTRQAKSLLELVDHFPGKVLCWASDLIYEEGKI